MVYMSERDVLLFALAAEEQLSKALSRSLQHAAMQHSN
jgi:hypothetical protein